MKVVRDPRRDPGVFPCLLAWFRLCASSVVRLLSSAMVVVLVRRPLPEVVFLTCGTNVVDNMGAEDFQFGTPYL
jgi:hypothetical protein